MAERAPGGFAAVYAVLKAFEEAGRVRRGYFVEGLGAAQFAAPGAVDRMRALAAAQPSDRRAAVGDARARRLGLLPVRPRSSASGATRRGPWCWPRPTRPTRTAGRCPGPSARPTGRTARAQPARKAGALVVLVDGALVLYVERGGKTLLSFRDDEGCLGPAVDALALAVRDGALGRLTVTKADGEAALTSPLGLALEAAGFRPTPRGLRLRA